MKMLTLTLVLMSFSGLSEARSWKHNTHHSHNSGHNNSYFWEDIERRQHQQYLDVNCGIDEGQLTRREIKKLKRERKHVAKELKHYRRHNHLSRSNKSDIHRHLNHYSRQIDQLTHNARYARSNHYNKQYNSRPKKNNNYYNRNSSWANNNYSSGFYFRF